MSRQNYFTGYWNGHKAMYRVIEATVGPEPQELKEIMEKQVGPRYLWFIPFIGKVRQVVEVYYQKEKPFYLDNEDGSGLFKVTTGQGSPRVSHRNVYIQCENEVVEVPKHNWNQFSTEAFERVEQETDAAWLEIDPEGYTTFRKKMEQMQESMRALQNKYFKGKNGKHVL